MRSAPSEASVSAGGGLQPDSASSSPTPVAASAVIFGDVGVFGHAGSAIG
jgi:hypothetical protein